MIYTVYDELASGKENAISTADLCKRLDLKSSRELRKLVEIERKAGKVILSSSTGGYYKAANKAEIEEFVKMTERKGIHTLAAVQSAKKALEVLDGQQTVKY